MTKRQAKDLLEKRGFQIWAVHNMREFQAMDRWGINLFVDWEEDSFRLAWSIPKTIFTLNCPDCNPFSSQTQFEKMYFGFKKQVRKLKEEWRELRHEEEYPTAKKGDQPGDGLYERRS